MSKITVVPYRRKRSSKTNYKKRLAMLKSGEPRLVIRKSVDNISGQIVKYHDDGDKIIISAHSRELGKIGWKLTRKSVPASYLTGYMLGKKAMAKKIKFAVPDFGFHRSTQGSRIYAFMKGMKEAGVELSVPDEKLPKDDRTSGKHIAKFAESLKENKVAYEKQFSSYLKKNIDPTMIPSIVDEIKKKITG